MCSWCIYKPVDQSTMTKESSFMTNEAGEKWGNSEFF